MAKTAAVRARMDETLKHNVDKIIAGLGLNASQVITMLYKQIELQRGLPFEVKIPNKETLEAFAEKPEDMESANSVEEMFEKFGI